MDVTLRPATAADTDFARAVHHAAYGEVVVRQFGAWDERQQDDFFAAAWNAGGHEIILVAGTPVGYCAIEDREQDIHLRELVIAPASQGQGIATRLLRQLQDKALRALKPIRLGTFTQNRALVLYKRLGFNAIGGTSTHVLLEWRPDEM
jgi:ribosomal protein S18 acetylase RimI-like enzyme